MTATGEFTHFDIPGICTHGPAPVPGQDLYDSTMITAAQLMVSLSRVIRTVVSTIIRTP